MTVGARGATAGLVAAVIALFACAVALGGGLSPNPANDPRLLNKPIEDFRYDEATRCRDEPTRGMKALEKWLGRNVRGTSWGIMRCERSAAGCCEAGRLQPPRRGPGPRLAPRRPEAQGPAAAMRLIRALITRDHNGERAALARRMGVAGPDLRLQELVVGPGQARQVLVLLPAERREAATGSTPPRPTSTTSTSSSTGPGRGSGRASGAPPLPTRVHGHAHNEVST